MSEPDRQAVRQVRVRHEGGGDGGVVLELIIDNPPVNALSHAVRVGLAAGIAAAGRDASVAAVVIRADGENGGRTFPAGADITEFGKPALAPLLPDLCNLVEACAKPVVAAVQGTALGGGLELAMAAHYRVARADAKLGLPEVGLGILPGAGGTQRMPRLIGAEQALRLMLGGRPVGAAEALALGLLDRVVEDGLETAALAMARAAMGRTPVPTRERRDGMRDGMAYQAAVAAARLHQRGARLPAPARIVDCVEAAQLLPFDQGLAYERRAFTDLVATPEAAGLRHAFFAERAAARMPEAGAAPRALREIGVAGAGGADVVPTLLQAGYAVTLAEADRPALVAALEAIAARQAEAVQAGRLSPEARDADWARLQPGAGAGALAEADLVLIADAAALSGVAQAARPGAVLVLLDPDAGAMRGAGAWEADLLGLLLPAQGGRLAEVVVGPGIAADAVVTVLALLRKIGRVAVRTTDPGGIGAPVMAAGRAAAAHLAGAGYGAAEVAAALAGFGLAGPVAAGLQPQRDTGENAGAIIARVLAAMANEGARLVGQGVALRPSDVDLALILGQGFPRWEGGPMHWADQQGLLLLRHDLWAWAGEAPELWSVAPLIDELISTGRHFGDLNAR